MGFRFIESRDTGRKFETGEPLMDRFDLEYYYRRSEEPGTMVIVMEDKGEISALMLLMVGRSSLTVEMLAKNRYVHHPGAGVEMLNCAETNLAGQLDISYISLEALDRKKLVEFYSRRGYVITGPPVHDRQWGTLFPMAKWLARIDN